MNIRRTKHLGEMTLISDPTVLAIPINENNDPIVDLRNQSVIAFGPSPEVPNNTNYTKIRQTVYKMLVKAQFLLPHNIKFCLYEGYRSLALQKRIFNEHLQHILARHPSWPADEAFSETTKLVSPLINFDGSENIPPHTTGGAIDLYLIDVKGCPLDMGIHPKD
jgi:D-alanyl-D-alanine dipeptidase